MWIRNKTFYAQMRVEGAKSPVRVKLQHAATIPQAIEAMQATRVRRRDGTLTVTSPSALTDFWLLMEGYKGAGCPGADFKARTDHRLEEEKERVGRMTKWHAWPVVEQIRSATLDRYAAWRKLAKRMRNGRRINQEMVTLKNALRWALRSEFIKANPLAAIEVVDYQWAASVRSKNRRPEDAEELHKIARWFFKFQESEVFAFQMLFEAFSGVRTSEALACRWDAKYGEPGFCDGEYLHLARKKQGVNPWVKIHPALSELLKVIKKWRAARHPESPWFFPSPYMPEQTVSATGLVHALVRAAKKLGVGKYTSHGMRGYYATARRSEFVPDAVIAAEMGDSSGAMIVVHNYGDLPPNWKDTKAGKVTWLPAKGGPAWKGLHFGAEKRNRAL